MKFRYFLSFFVLFIACAISAVSEEDGWISLFDGESLDGWEAGEHPDTPKVEDGVIVCHGPRAHLFYVGPVMNHDFKNFEFQTEVMTFPEANSGVFFHTEFTHAASPRKGYEVQINNSFPRDKVLTGSLYDVMPLYDTPAKDNEWFTLYIRVEGKTVTVKVNEEQVLEYTEPENPQRSRGRAQRLISSGTFALQAHDPNSRALFRNIKVRPLPD